MDTEKAYDQITYKLSINIYSLNKEHDTINIYGYDDTKKSHKWFFHTAMTCSSMFSKKICMDAPFLTRLKLYWKHRDTIHWIRRVYAEEKETTDYTIEEILEFMLPSSQELTQNYNFTYDMIYDCYTQEVEKL